MRSAYRIDPLVLVGVPTLQPRPIDWEWADRFQAMAYPLGARVAIKRVHDQHVADARNMIVQTALDMDAQYVFFLSDDVSTVPNAFALLHRHRAPMVTGVYWTKGHPSKPYLWNGLLTEGPYEDWTYGEYFPVDWAGCDCLLVNTEVFKAIEPPWFGQEWVYESGHPVPALATEDVYFYTKARAAGFKLYCDSEVQCDHHDRATGMRYGLTDDMPQYPGRREQMAADPGVIDVADIGCGIATPWFGKQARVVRFDGDARVRPDVRCDLRAIPRPDETFDIVHVRHVLEHFMLDEAPTVLKEWARLVKVGGELQVHVPNLAYAAHEILRADADAAVDVGPYPVWQLFGRQTGDPTDLHRNGFTRHGLKRLFDHTRLLGVAVEVTGQVGENLTATWRKSASLKPYTIIDKWRAIESAERGDDAADLPVPGLPDDPRLNGAHAGDLALAGRTKASDD